MWIFDRKWYYTLDSSLISRGHLLMCYMPNEKTRLYSNFKDSIEFGTYYYNMEEKDRHFYEIIPGNLPQKPFYDLDIDDLNTNPQNILEIVIEYIIDSFLSINIVLDIEKHILVFNSHGPTKYSYHIIIDKYCFSDIEEAKYSFERLYSKLPKEVSKFVDKKVYTRNRQFRIVDSSKVGSTRFKRYQQEFSYKSNTVLQETAEDPHIRTLEILNKSLISITDYCMIIPHIYQKKIPSKLVSITIEDKMVNKAIQMLIPETKLESKDFPYQLTKVLDNGIIVLKRLNPTYCKLCQRQHEQENPFIIVVKKKTNISAYFNCRRNKRSLLIGVLWEYSETPKKSDNTINKLNKYDFERIEL